MSKKPDRDSVPLRSHDPKQKRTHHISLYLSNDEDAEARLMAGRAGIAVGAAIRHAALDPGRLAVMIRKRDLSELLGQVKKIGTNLNQIATVVNAQKSTEGLEVELCDVLRKTAAALDVIVQRSETDFSAANYRHRRIERFRKQRRLPHEILLETFGDMDQMCQGRSVPQGEMKDVAERLEDSVFEVGAIGSELHSLLPHRGVVEKGLRQIDGVLKYVAERKWDAIESTYRNLSGITNELLRKMDRADP